MLKKIISGGQNGADQAGLFVAKFTFGLETGGTIPRGFRTLDGDKPILGKLYGLVEHPSLDYPPRTKENVLNSDATVRLAFDFNTAGEKCTLREIKRAKKPFFDVNLHFLEKYVDDFVSFLKENNVQTLNVAGNSEKSHKGTFNHTVLFLTLSLEKYGLKNLTKEEIIYG